jgi:prepilin-type N-terminal cleavage/methylation domain-containing protein
MSTIFNLRKRFADYGNNKKRFLSLSGFTLVEIMIVVAIIVLLAAVSIPGLLRSRLNANEAAALTSLKTISWAAITYRTSNPSFPPDLVSLGNVSPQYIDSNLATGIKQGYNFTLAGDANSFNATAQPVSPNITGVRTFFVDTSGVIRASNNGTADSTSPPVS